MPFATTEIRSLRISLGAEERIEPGVPVLAGEAGESLFGSARPAGQVGGLTLFQSQGWLLGTATVTRDRGLESATHGIYRDMFRATQGWHLARIWNYVPEINEIGPVGLENYRVFCRGRSLAFEEVFGREFNARLPAASAVGSKSDALTVVFAACAEPPCHVESPLQVAAYDYPVAFGPRPPSFARATVVVAPAGGTVFISGTAAIRGHATIAPQHTRPQLECTLENLHAISTACGLGPNLDQGGRSTRHFKVYVRHADDQPMVAAFLQERLLVSTDRVTYLQADICRAPLYVEIEASLFGVTGLQPNRADHAPRHRP